MLLVNTLSTISIKSIYLNCRSIKCKIEAMPTFQVYKSGKKLGEVVGADINSVNIFIQILGWNFN